MMAKSTSLYFASNRHLAATLGVCNTLGVLAVGEFDQEEAVPEGPVARAASTLRTRSLGVL